MIDAGEMTEAEGKYARLIAINALSLITEAIEATTKHPTTK